MPQLFGSHERGLDLRIVKRPQRRGTTLRKPRRDIVAKGSDDLWDQGRTRWRREHFGPRIARAAQQFVDRRTRRSFLDFSLQPTYDAAKHLDIGIGAVGVLACAAIVLGQRANAMRPGAGQQDARERQRIEYAKARGQRDAQSLAGCFEQRAVVAGAIMRDEREIAGIGKEVAQHLGNRRRVLHLLVGNLRQADDMLGDGYGWPGKAGPRFLRHAIDPAPGGNLNNLGGGLRRIRACRLQIEDHIAAAPEGLP